MEEAHKGGADQGTSTKKIQAIRRCVIGKQLTCSSNHLAFSVLHTPGLDNAPFNYMTLCVLLSFTVCKVYTVNIREGIQLV